MANPNQGTELDDDMTDDTFTLSNMASGQRTDRATENHTAAGNTEAVGYGDTSFVTETDLDETNDGNISQAAQAALAAQATLTAQAEETEAAAQADPQQSASAPKLQEERPEETQYAPPAEPVQATATPNVASFSAQDLPDLREGEDEDPEIRKSRDEFTTVYDVIDQLEAMLDGAKTSIFSPGTVRVDRDELADQLHDLKTMLPVQLERASSLMREAERRLENAQAQAQSIIASAQSAAAQTKQDAEEQAQFLAGHERVTELAQQRARKILTEAQNKANKLTQGANNYCSQVMNGLQEQINKLGQDVQNGLDVLAEREDVAARQLAKSNHDQQVLPEEQ